MQSWFEHEFGLRESADACQVRDAFELRHAAEDVVLVSKRNQKEFLVGSFEVPTVSELSRRLQEMEQGIAASGPSESGANPDPSSHGAPQPSGLTFGNIAGSARAFLMDPVNAGAVFQVASQFNCLEMAGPETLPEHGITDYCRDKTQGPACAMACPAATLFRNYFCPVQSLLDSNERATWTGQLGGSKCQLDTTRDVAKLVDNEVRGYWAMRNGYLLPKDNRKMQELGARLTSETVTDTSGTRRGLADAVTTCTRVGVHWNTQTASPLRQWECGQGGHCVCQVLCSAVPVAYARSTSAEDWAPFACAILNAQYEALLAVAAICAAREGRRVKVFMTSVGGGSFGNRTDWILSAASRALHKFARHPLDVYLIHFMRVPDSGAFSDLAAAFPPPPSWRAASSHTPQPTHRAKPTPGVKVGGVAGGIAK